MVVGAANHLLPVSAVMADRNPFTVTKIDRFTGNWWRGLIPTDHPSIRPQWHTTRHKNHETPRLLTPVAGEHFRQKEKRHETA